MSLTPEQRRIAGLIVGIGRARGERRKRIVANLETGIVESNLRNLPYGDGSSVGYRQETKSSYPNVNRRNVRGAINRFYDEARRVPTRGRTAGQIAQAVQRSAFPGRYHQHRGEALRLYRKLSHGGGGSVGGGGGAIRIPGTPGSISVQGVDPGGPELANLLRAELTRVKPGVPQSAPAPPAFAARPAMPTGYQPIQASVIPAASQSSVSDLLAQASRIPAGALPGVNVTPGSPGMVLGAQGGNGRLKTGAGGSVHVAAGANRGGVGVKPVVKRYLSGVSALTHHPITITTGTRHNRLTVDGRVSDHWDGHAADIGVPVDSHQGDLIATAALIQAGVPRARARAMARRGGLYTINRGGLRIQVIWRTNAGGNHHNHVHVGVRPV